MKKQITVCNRCETPIEGSGIEFSLFNERRSNGTEYENWHWVADLCPKCARLLVKNFLKIADGWPQDQRAALAKEFKAIEQ